MDVVLTIIQVTVGLGILNVWLVRRNLDTPFRGGKAKSMVEEFKVYGLPEWAVPVVGVFKVSLAIIILGGFFVPYLTPVGATLLGLFMLGAVLMHIKVQDSLVKTIPSVIMLILCGVLALAGNPDILSLAANF